MEVLAELTLIKIDQESGRLFLVDLFGEEFTIAIPKSNEYSEVSSVYKIGKKYPFYIKVKDSIEKYLDHEGTVRKIKEKINNNPLVNATDEQRNFLKDEGLSQDTIDRLFTQKKGA